MFACLHVCIRSYYILNFWNVLYYFTTPLIIYGCNFPISRVLSDFVIPSFSRLVTWAVSFLSTCLTKYRHKFKAVDCTFNGYSYFTFTLRWQLTSKCDSNHARHMTIPSYTFIFKMILFCKLYWQYFGQHIVSTRYISWSNFGKLFMMRLLSLRPYFVLISCFRIAITF